MTLLSLHAAEGLQMVFYVLGGFIRIHSDFLNKLVSSGV